MEKYCLFRSTLGCWNDSAADLVATCDLLPFKRRLSHQRKSIWRGRNRSTHKLRSISIDSLSILAGRNETGRWRSERKREEGGEREKWSDRGVANREDPASLADGHWPGYQQEQLQQQHGGGGGGSKRRGDATKNISHRPSSAPSRLLVKHLSCVISTGRPS